MAKFMHQPAYLSSAQTSRQRQPTHLIFTTRAAFPTRETTVDFFPHSFKQVETFPNLTYARGVRRPGR